MGLMQLWTRAASQPQERKEPSFDIRNASPENPSTNLANPAEWLFEVLGGGGVSSAGMRVNEQTAMRFTAVFRCVSLLSALVAMLPLSVYQRTANGRVEAVQNRLYPLLHDAPNEAMGSFTWREFIMVSLLLRGNHLSVIDYDNAARIIGFTPVMWQQVSVKRVKRRNRYTIQFDDGREIVDQDEVLHVPGIGFDGVKGMSPIGAVGKDAIGVGLAMQEFSGRMHANAAVPGGVIEVANGLSPEALGRLRAQFNEQKAGVRNVGQTLFLDSGMKWTAMQISPQDAQTLESRRFQVADICRIFGVPPHLVGETDKSTSWGSGIEQQTIGFLTFALEPWLKRIEDELQRKLFTGTDFYAEFNRDALLAIDAKTRGEQFASGIQNGYIKPNEARRKLNMPDEPGGDRLFIQSNLVPLNQAGAAAQPSAQEIG